MDDVVLNQAEIVERCVRRVREVYADDAEAFRDDLNRQESVLLNLPEPARPRSTWACTSSGAAGWASPRRAGRLSTTSLEPHAWVTRGPQRRRRDQPSSATPTPISVSGTIQRVNAPVGSLARTVMTAHTSAGHSAQRPPPRSRGNR